jgi:Archaea bacterial proteins of unknown function
LTRAPGGLRRASDRRAAAAQAAGPSRRRDSHLPNLRESPAGCGRTLCRIRQHRANQRIDYTLTKLREAGYVRAERPVGAGDTVPPHYGITDVYLAFWLSVLRDDAELIEGGQGRAVLHRQRTRLERHVSATFKQLAREHAVRLVAAGPLPADTIVGRWWRDETVEIDVLGLSGDRPVLVGEAKWQREPLTLSHPMSPCQAVTAGYSRRARCSTLARDPWSLEV